MLRCLALSLLGLSLLAAPAAARGEGPAGGRRAEAKPAVAGGAKAAERPLLLHRVAATIRPVAAASGVAACARGRGGALRCRGGAARTANWGGWARGLPPALGVQAQECPAGTMGTLAQGHEDIVRCIPI
jgi:hypothetical protein